MKPGDEAPFGGPVGNPVARVEVGSGEDVLEQRQRQLGFVKGHVAEVLDHRLFDGHLVHDGLPHQLELHRLGRARSLDKLPADVVPGFQDFGHELFRLAVATLTHVRDEGERLAFEVIAERDGVHTPRDHRRPRIGRGVGGVLHPQLVVDLPADVHDQHQQDREHEDGKHRQHADRAALVAMHAGQERRTMDAEARRGTAAHGLGVVRILKISRVHIFLFPTTIPPVPNPNPH